MPGKVKVKILSGRNLPVMDRSSDTTDAYVEIKLGNTTYKTDVCRKSLNPQWNSEWYRFEVDDSELQDEPLQIRLMDHDTYSANDAIGKVYLDLNPLLLPNSPAPVRNPWSSENIGSTTCCTSSGGGSFMSGWIPVYDTMHGIRGEVNICVKVELFSDFNKFRQSSCGVQFFCSPVIPQGYHAQVIHGFVEELVVNDDPEYQWIDKIRTPRASNEARQTLFFKLSGEIQRKIGLKALDLGGNAVIGYCQNFDLEGESGIVARGIGTAVTLTRIQDGVIQMDTNFANESFLVAPSNRKCMMSNSNAVAISALPLRLREKSPREIKYKTISEDSGNGSNHSQTFFGKRFPCVEKKAVKSKNRNIKVVHQNVPLSNRGGLRSHSVERGNLPKIIKRGKSTQSLCNDSKGPGNCDCENHRENKFFRGLKAIGFSHKNKLLRKIPAFRNKFNSDSSTVEASESEVESLSDLSQKESFQAKDGSEQETKEKYHRAYSDSSYYELSKVVEVKESTLSPPGTPRQGKKSIDIQDKVFSEDYDRQESSSADSSSSDSFSDDDSSSESSTNETIPVILPSVHRAPCKRSSKLWHDKRSRKDKNDETNGLQNHTVTTQLTPVTETNDIVDSPQSVDVVTNLDLACPQISVISCDQEVSTNSLTPYHTPSSCHNDNMNCNNIAKPPLFKSKSATALSVYPSHECESTLSSVLIAPDYKEHGPCLIPSSRNDAEVTERIPGPGTYASTVVPQNSVSTGVKPSHSSAKVSSVPCIHRRSSDSDLSITPKGNSLTGSDKSYGAKESHCRQNSLLVRPSMNQENLDMLEYPFLTMSKYPPGFINHLGGTVSARSVKLLERITNLEEPETRDAWWTELRMEVRSHARAMGCNVVIGYSEITSICDDICVLSASGTAALINLNSSTSETDIPLPIQHLSNRTNTSLQQLHQGKEIISGSLDRCDFEKDSKINKLAEKPGADVPSFGSFNLVSKPRHSTEGSQDIDLTTCSICHLPYNENSVPFRVTTQKCAVCRRNKVPDVLFTTIDIIDNVPTIGKGSFIHAYVCRPKRDCKGEMNAKEISDGLPFLEYELHRLLINKLKVRGMNAIFGLKVQVSIGEKILIGLATGTAVFLTPLPAPPVPKISAGNSWKDSKKLNEMQKQLQETVKKSKDFYHIKPFTELGNVTNGRRLSEDTDESDDDYADLDLSHGNKDTCILEVDDAEDADAVSLLIDPTPPEGFHVVSTDTVHGLEDLEIVKNLQMFTQVWRAKIPFGQPLSAFNQHFNRLLQSVYFKLRHMVPCALSDLQFEVILEQDEIQLSLLGMALGLGESEFKKKKSKSRLISGVSKECIKKLDDSDLIFNLEEDSASQIKAKNRSPIRSETALKHTPPRSRYGVDITPLPHVPGGKIERYLGNLNFFFIRESTCVREGGGLGGLIHSFITEVLAIVRAHVTALGGNAMVSYFMSKCFLYHYPHKNQGQCLINVGGDVVYISYYPED